MTELELEVIEAMVREGGSFVVCLGRAFSHADPENFRRLRAAFPEYWIEYERIAETRRVIARSKLSP